MFELKLDLALPYFPALQVQPATLHPLETKLILVMNYLPNVNCLHPDFAELSPSLFHHISMIMMYIWLKKNCFLGGVSQLSFPASFLAR